LAVRRIVVAEVVKYLADPNTPKTVLTTPDHVKWVLEVTGQSFSLPVEVCFFLSFFLPKFYFLFLFLLLKLQ